MDKFTKYVLLGNVLPVFLIFLLSIFSYYLVPADLYLNNTLASILGLIALAPIVACFALPFILAVLSVKYQVYDKTKKGYFKSLLVPLTYTLIFIFGTVLFYIFFDSSSFGFEGLFFAGVLFIIFLIYISIAIINWTIFKKSSAQK